MFMKWMTGGLIVVSLFLMTGCSDGKDIHQPDEANPAKPTELTSSLGPADTSSPGDEPQTVAPMEKTKPMVIIETSLGEITVELWADRAPITVESFLAYVDEGFYDGTVFHRVIAEFMIQGGGFTPQLQKKETRDSIQNEASAELKNERGTIAMARTGEIHSATSQFFINTVDNDFLDHRDETPRGFGYAVFGKVVEGMEVVDRIRAVSTRTAGGMGDVPAEPVVIESIRRAD